MVQYPLDNARAITVDIADVDAKKIYITSLVDRGSQAQLQKLNKYHTWYGNMAYYLFHLFLK